MNDILPKKQKKFVGKINGFTKFLIALGTLNSPYDEKIKITNSTILHYVHIPNIVRTHMQKTIRKNEQKNVVSSAIDNDGNNLEYFDKFNLKHDDENFIINLNNNF